MEADAVARLLGKNILYDANQTLAEWLSLEQLARLKTVQCELDVIVTLVIIWLWGCYQTTATITTIEFIWAKVQSGVAK